MESASCGPTTSARATWSATLVSISSPIGRRRLNRCGTLRKAQKPQQAETLFRGGRRLFRGGRRPVTYVTSSPRRLRDSPYDGAAPLRTNGHKGGSSAQTPDNRTQIAGICTTCATGAERAERGFSPRIPAFSTLVHVTPYKQEVAGSIPAPPTPRKPAG